MANVQALLAKLDAAAKPLCDVAECQTIDDKTMVRLLRQGELKECEQSVYVVYSSAGGSPFQTTKRETPAILHHLRNDARSCWIRHVLMRAPPPVILVDSLFQAYSDLSTALHVARTIADDYRSGHLDRLSQERFARAMTAIRSIPKCYRMFCDEVRTKLSTL